MFGNLGATEIIFIMVIVLLVFGAKRLPEIGQSLGKGIREFKKSMSDISGEINQAAQQPPQYMQPPPQQQYAPPAQPQQYVQPGQPYGQPAAQVPPAQTASGQPTNPAPTGEPPQA